MASAVIGCGYWGKHYVRILALRKQCAWAVDASEPARVALARKHGVKCAANAATAFAGSVSFLLQ